MNEIRKTCCFFGHRKISETDSLRIRIYEIVENLILHYNVDTFLMGSRSEFDSLYREVLSQLPVHKTP